MHRGQGARGSNIDSRGSNIDYSEWKWARFVRGVPWANIGSSYDPRSQILTEKSINVDMLTQGRFPKYEITRFVLRLSVSSTVDMMDGQFQNVSHTHCVVFLVDFTIVHVINFQPCIWIYD